MFSGRASPVQWAGPRRVHAPGLAFDALPHIDAVLLSHDHYDHFDTATLRRLAVTHDPLFIAPLRHRDLLTADDPSPVCTVRNALDRPTNFSYFLAASLHFNLVSIQLASAIGAFDLNIGAHFSFSVFLLYCGGFGYANIPPVYIPDADHRSGDAPNRPVNLAFILISMCRSLASLMFIPACECCACR